jgi:hypothetical protein
MPELIVILAVVVVIVVAVAYALGMYVRRRSDDLPPRPPTAGSPAKRMGPTAAPARSEVPDRELRVVINWLLSQAFEQTGIRVADDKLAYDRIVEAARKAVATLKTQDMVEISLPFLTADTTGPKHLAARLTRDMIAELVKY